MLFAVFGCTLKYHSRLQWEQNALARITVFLRTPLFPLRLTTLLWHLHWLPTDSHISLELSTITTLYDNIQSAGLWSSSISCRSSP